MKVNLLPIPWSEAVDYYKLTKERNNEFRNILFIWNIAKFWTKFVISAFRKSCSERKGHYMSRIKRILRMTDWKWINDWRKIVYRLTIMAITKQMIFFMIIYSIIFSLINLVDPAHVGYYAYCYANKYDFSE